MNDPGYTSIDVDELDAAVTELEQTVAGLRDGVVGLQADFAYFGVDQTRLNALIEAEASLADWVPQLRERHRLAVQLLSRLPTRQIEEHGDVVTFTGDLLSDAELVHDANVSEALDALRESGHLTGEPSTEYELWVSNTLSLGLEPDEIVERAEAEGVGPDTFDPLGDLEYVDDPDGFRYYHLENADDARLLAELTELVNGGQPSLSADRRDANSWTFDTVAGYGNVDLVLDGGGAVMTTPEGILMAAPAQPEPIRLPRIPIDIPVPSLVDLLSFGGGTQWGEMFVVNGAYDDPDGFLTDVVERGSLYENGTIPLYRLLRHEGVHADQWAEHGHPGFLTEYFGHHVDGSWQSWPPFYRVEVNTSGCVNGMEESAGFGDGGYHGCLSDDELQQWREDVERENEQRADRPGP